MFSGPAPSLGVGLIVKSEFYRLRVTPNGTAVPKALGELPTAVKNITGILIGKFSNAGTI